MQDRYAGDIGDYGKLGLLRYLQTKLTLALGVVWYLHRDETHTADGRFTEYLQCEDSRFRCCDPQLWLALRHLVHSGRRSVEEIRLSGVLRVGHTKPAFFTRPVDCSVTIPGQSAKQKKERREYRRKWNADGLKKVRTKDLVFLDPDNGLEVASCSKKHQYKAGKYTFHDEVQKFAGQSRVLVIYHHLNRHSNHGTHQRQLVTQANRLQKLTGNAKNVFGLRYRPKSPRAFFVIADAALSSQTLSSLESFLASAWRPFWDPQVVTPQ